MDTAAIKTELESAMKALGVQPAAWNAKTGLAVTAPVTGEVIATLPESAAVAGVVMAARKAQQAWQETPLKGREAFIHHLSETVKQHQQALAAVLSLESGKTPKEAAAEVAGSADVLAKTVKDAALPDVNGIARTKERTPAGVVAVITSFNFPLSVANWNIGPALLAGNAVVWKPSEKTPLTAIAYEAVFRKAAASSPVKVPEALLQVVVGDRSTGSALVIDEGVDLVSATGSVAMGNAIRTALAKKRNNAVPPILELGGNNALVITQKNAPAMLERAVTAMLSSFLGTAGQRCTNTRRLFVHSAVYEGVLRLLKDKIEAFLATSPWDNPANDSGYGPLIDNDALARFEQAITEAKAQGGKLSFGRRVQMAAFPQAAFVEPAILEMPAQTEVMHKEIFAPLLFVVKYAGDVSDALALVNAPENAGLVNGIYTQDEAEAEAFARGNLAGHTVVNSPRGTGMPANGMGFGGNRESGTGEILNVADPLAAFTRPGRVRRVAIDRSVPFDWA